MTKTSFKDICLIAAGFEVGGGIGLIMPTNSWLAGAMIIGGLGMFVLAVLPPKEQ